ncbi:cupin domain-containing protein [Paenibacillus caui]|uniref:cupin domain-containing protein n=1 Tax=Paenibacillus caui TaxID=2873927 RepID=UPI001CA9260A|nr:cupin [Paenibacillus caui]
MKIYNFGKEVGNPITHYDSNFIMSRILSNDAPARVGCMHLEANGIIGYHQAPVPQLLLIVQGEGQVRSGGKNDSAQVIAEVKAGDAIFWEQGEWHETLSLQGLTAFVIESEEMNPAQFMPEKSEG